MLVLSRNIGQVIRIADEIQIIVLGIKGNQVRLGIDAPPGIVINREEIHRKLQQDNCCSLHLNA